ncbi:protein scarlet-like isoform X3 [Frieseomelitta varia]|uniref:protein scarlet-like isoform X3 n=1 Tax=Frieseomelitta varia TaxID=561572 RepID=UPI001CB6840D|nr:protein scarlet-like isoform X3 [Frieseomelitta varia]
MILYDTVRTTGSVMYPVLQPNILKDLCLTWRNISYTVEKKVNGGSLRAIFGLQHTEFIQLLNGVNGIVNSGMLMAIMGPSGAGKTTLLATISRRVKGKATGDVLLNGKPIDTGQMIRISGFVPQTDLAVESLTILEHMEFMACMKMDRRLRASVRKQRIMTLLGELGLAKSTGTKLSALSGGERKRVTLAVQLLTEPSILFCDEPTTGLDSYGAMTVVKTLREVAASGRIVICSLHQPASGLLEIFHEVLLLSGGRVAFQGSSIDATNFFDSLGLRCPPTFNNAEFFVSQLSIVRGKEAESYKKFIGLLISLPYMNITGQALDQGSIQNMQGLLYLVVVETVFTFNYAVFYTFPRELPLLLRDIASGLYGPTPYYISKVIVLIPGAIIQPLLYSAFIFAITGLKGGLLGFVYFVLPVVVCAISASALGLFLSASFQSVDTASLFSVPLDFLGLMFCGIYLHLDHLAPGIAWLKYLSQFYYGLEAVSLMQWLLIDHINCSPDPEEPCISSGLGVLEKYGYLPNHYVTDIVGLLVIFVVSHLAGFLVIKHRSRKEPIY